MVKSAQLVADTLSVGKSAEIEIRGGGGVVTRLDSHGRREVLIIHRPASKDWSFPKGKCDGDEETYKQAALREVFEETGFRCATGSKLNPVEYRDRRGRMKRLQYWEMAVLDGEFVSNDEVDRAKWVTFARAFEKLTHKRDRRLLSEVHDIGESTHEAA